MRSILSAGLIVAALAACAPAPDRSGVAASPAQPAPGVSALSVVGTPFLVIFKIPVCIVTVAVAAPMAGISELLGPSNPAGADLRRNLSDGIDQNCGPPYVVAAAP